MKRYQVVGELAHVVMTDHTGVSAMTLLYKGAFLPDNVDPDRLNHLLSVGLVAEVGDVPIAPNAAVPQDGRVGIPPLTGDVPTPEADGMHPVVTEEQRQSQREAVEADPDVEARRAAARERLAELGDKAPDGRASKDVLVEYLVASGSRYEDLASAEKQELVEMVKARQQ